ncbi:MAG TPA: PTS system mannose/fructose/sorbose family transporter subunit IID [Syntrophales bacterium]|nr:PTS system mannose/fructose/sorbose family transporter subunit IID [Syntrophales bacterium]HPQ45052.1 PTS system mannose/fructose/sorbose family transporter subunit IID [Syntrophales bacterium]
MRKIDLIEMFLRSLFVQSSWNFKRKQNVGFAYSLIPLAKRFGENTVRISGLLTRHIRSFNSHPYLTGTIIGSIARLEESSEDDNCTDALRLKETLMGPYAAIGDPFFWGGLKPLASVAGVILAVGGMLIAPLVLLLLYNTIHVWIRLKGFIEGYRDGKGGIRFLSAINLPGKTRILKWITTFLLALLCAVFVHISIPQMNFPWEIMAGGAFALILICFWLIGRGISFLTILYGVVALACVITE